MVSVLLRLLLLTAYSVLYYNTRWVLYTSTIDYRYSSTGINYTGNSYFIPVRFNTGTVVLVPIFQV